MTLRRFDGGVELQIATHASVADSVVVRGAGRVAIGSFSSVEDNVLIDLGSSGLGAVMIADRVKLKWGSIYRCYNGTLEVGARTSIGDYTVILAHGGVTIGRDVGIAHHCSIAAANHIMDDPAVPIRYQGERALGIAIRDGAWIGAGVRVLDGVTVGAGTAIGAGAVVTRSQPAGFLCVGIPCMPIRPLGRKSTGPPLKEDV